MPTWVISYNDGRGVRFVRWYKNGRQWVDRMHGATATQYQTREAALAVAEKMNLPRMELRA